MISEWKDQTEKKIIVHYDNARPHIAKIVNDFLESHDMDKAPHPPFSPDIAPSDFYLFGYIKGLLAGKEFDSPEQLLSDVTQILEEIPTITLLKVFQQWESRLIHVIDSNGDYIE